MPNGSNSARSLSSSTSSTRFLMYRFMPWYLATRSWRISSNLGAMPASQGVALHMRLRPELPSTSAAGHIVLDPTLWLTALRSPSD